MSVTLNSQPQSQPKPQFQSQFHPKDDFPLSFVEAMNLVFDGKAVQGRSFHWRCYLTLNDFTQEVALGEFLEHSINHYAPLERIGLTHGLMSQKYREVTVLNKAGLAIKGVNYVEN